MQSKPYRNIVLAHLGQDELERLQLSPITLEAGRPLMSPGKNCNRVLFVETGLASTVVTFADGKQVETNLLGADAVIGIFKIIATGQPRHQTSMEISGTGYAAPAEMARREFSLNGKFYQLLVQCLQIRIYETMQIAACNGVHSQQQRFARWLLQCSAQAGTNVLPVSQSRVAELLACRPSSVSEASSGLQDLGIIAQHRGCIEILDPFRLEQRSCECIHALRSGMRAAFDAALR